MLPESSRLIATTLLVFALGVNPARLTAAPTYEKDIRPLLKAHCFHCHGEGEKLRGGLDFRLHRLLIKGGDSGPAVVAGKPEKSWLLERVRLGEMPPGENAKKLSKDEVALLAAWIKAGAGTARPEPVDADPDNYITEEERAFWSFQPVLRPEVPRTADAARLRTPIDAFVLARLEANKLDFATDAEKQTLIRRAYLDLLGLPPTPEEVDEFLADKGANAYEDLIDRLLASPHYGERWGRHWLDAAGYADSEGYTENDQVRPHAWKYRDYVVRSLNADKPYDDFVREQLAGDEMVPQAYQDLSPEQVDALKATGFLRMAPDGTAGSGVEQGEARNETIAKTIEIVSTSLLGLTVGCAQCHDHRYDPISQKDYYRFRAVFDPALDWKNWLNPTQRRLSLYSDADRKKAGEIEAEAKKVDAERLRKQEQFIEATLEKELARLPEAIREPIRVARKTPAAKLSAEQKKLLKEHPSVNVSPGSLYLYDQKAADELKALAEKAAGIRESKPKEELLRALWEPAGKSPPPSFVFARGDHEQPKDRVGPGELSILARSSQADIPADDPALLTTGRRLAYARWLTGGQHPLLARVVVNRVWLHHFGMGLVPTPGDFGALGVRPTHPELLDWLASELMQDWSLKRLHRLIMTSTVYIQASRASAEALKSDADNRLYSHYPLRRLEAEVIRDSVLAVSGRLNRKAFGPPVPVMADTVGQFVLGIENLNAGRPGAVIPMGGEEFRRSLWTQVRRSRPLSVLEAFDMPRMEPNCTGRASSTVSTQSLLFMNNEFIHAHARDLAGRARREAGPTLKAQVERAWQLVYSRPPSEAEMTSAVKFLGEQTAFFAGKPAKDVQPAEEALTSLCHALISSNEFLYVE
jgi:mono/diheme cytochrome c family protein